MLMLQSEVDARLANPDNLLNRLRMLDITQTVHQPVLDADYNLQDSDSDSAPNQMLVNTADDQTDIIIDSILRANQPFIAKRSDSPSLDDLVPDGLDRIKTNLAQNTALAVMQESLDNLKMRMHEVETPKELSRIAREMSTIIGQLKPKEDDKPRQGNIIIYKPIVAEVSQYKSVVVNE